MKRCVNGIKFRKKMPPPGSAALDQLHRCHVSTSTKLLDVELG